MGRTTESRGRRVVAILATVSAVFGLALGFVGASSLAELTGPTEHAGLRVDPVGVVSEESMRAQIDLSGYVLQLREITIEPGGQIAQHDHATRPGLVKVISGVWTEGRPEGETEFRASNMTGIIEGHDTVHWFWNTGNEPATALVCDIVPAE